MTLKRNVAVVKSIIRAKWRLAQAPIILSIMFSAPLMTTNTSFRLQDTPPDVVFFFNFFTRCHLAIFFYIPRRQIHLCLFFYVKNWTLSFRVIFDVNRETEKLWRNRNKVSLSLRKGSIGIWRWTWFWTGFHSRDLKTETYAKWRRVRVLKRQPTQKSKKWNSVYREMPNPPQQRPVKNLTQILVKYVASFLHQMAKVRHTVAFVVNHFRKGILFKFHCVLRKTSFSQQQLWMLGSDKGFQSQLKSHHFIPHHSYLFAELCPMQERKEFV